MTSTRIPVVIVGGHPVISGLIRLGCQARPEIEIVGEAQSAAGAARVVLETCPSVVILDLDLPDADGLEVLGRWRSAGYDGHILVVSDRHDGGTVFEAIRRGAEGYLGKSSGLRDVAASVIRLASGEQILDPALERAALFELGRFAQQAREGAEAGGTVTPRELEILGLLSGGLTMRQAARRLGISPRTVEVHVGKIYRKLGVKTRIQAVARATSLGLIQLE